MSTATLAGKRATHARLTIPSWGVPWAEVSLDGEHELSGLVELKIADLALSCTVMSGGPAKGRSNYRVAAGKGGWGKTIPSKSYANDAGVKASIVLQDAAQAAGESLDASTLPSTRVGPAWARESAPASRVLQLLSPEAWYVDTDGTTKIGTRTGEFTGKAQLGPVDESRGTVTLASDSIATLLPGVTVADLDVVDVLHDVSPDGLRSTVWGAGVSETSRRAAAMKRIIDALYPEMRYRGCYEYRVVTQEASDRINLQPIRVSLGMPDIRRAYVRPGVPGCRADLALGSRVLVTFVDADPARPVVVAFEESSGDGFAPTRLDLVGEDDSSTTVPGSIGRVIRYGDTVTVGSQTGEATYSIGPVSRVRA